MDEIEMLCLANSRKEGDRCVAGLRSDGTWIRPVSTPQGGALTSTQLMLAEVGRQSNLSTLSSSRLRGRCLSRISRRTG